ncbi:MAG TPA: thiamine pyrophosphate-binding protein [Thermoanaerobaculia bacterium]|jgi:acetolactate synthase-1/2/3 large subunit
MIKLSDYVVDYLVGHGVEEIFLVSGGGIMHLVDSVGRDPRIRYVCNYHEQASAIAAEACARIKNRVAACLVTTGPGATNALSGIAGAWFDSIPVLVLSGQVRTPLIADYQKLRQLGPQEVNIVPMAKPVTKYVASIRDPQTIRKDLDRAFSAATADRPGPVWIEIPLDIQYALIDESRLSPFEAERPAPRSLEALRQQARAVHGMLQEARRPVLVLGNGVRLAGGEEELSALLEATRIPILLTIGGMDLVAEDHPRHMGAFGPVGRRASNFALQNSDLILSIGASLSVASIGFNAAGFAPKARKIAVNIDEGELTKENVIMDLGICSDARAFLSALREELAGRLAQGSEKWLAACADWKRRYPAVASEAYAEKGFVNSYAFVDHLSDLLHGGEVIVTGNSLDACSVYQAFRVKPGQRVLVAMNYGAMGWDLPAAVGAAVANRPEKTILVTGDGSIQFNVQELQTVRQNDLPLKIFVFNNDGYESIRATQTTYFEGRFVGADRASGIGNPDFAKLAAAYGLPYASIRTNAELDTVDAFLLEEGPGFCELFLSPTQGRNPKVTSFRREDGSMESKPLEDMYPFLPREEIWRNMHLFDDEGTG